MNTINSVYYGWGFLICAGAGSYYFAKRSINKDRAERMAWENERRMRQNRQYAQNNMMQQTSSGSGVAGAASSMGTSTQGKESASSSGGPSVEASRDPAPTEHEQNSERWEATKVWRAPKGDRFSGFTKN